MTNSGMSSVGTPNSRWQLRKMFSRSSSGAADIISTHTDDRVGDTEFFAYLEEDKHHLACLRRSEVEAGNLLGVGTFTEIHAVSSISLDALTQSQVAPGNRTKREVLQASVLLPSVKMTQPQQQYCIKQLTRKTLEETKDPKVVARAARELVNDAKFLSRLGHHPNIVTLRGLTLDAFGHNYLAHQFDDFFLVLDRLSDKTLADRIYKDWRLPLRSGLCEPDEDLIPMKANYAFQLAKALRFCHRNGVLYRDLKPSNVGFALHDPHCVQLLDFGLARDVAATEHDERAMSSSSTTPFRMTLAGTRRYLAGEVLTSGAYTWKSDVYSWAMTFYEMCAERKPYHGVTAQDHQRYVCERGVRPPLEDFYFPEALEDILTQSWHPNLNRRWTMDKVCQKMQTFLMTLDVTYYEQKEGDFLFDLELPPQEDIENLELAEDILGIDTMDDWLTNGTSSSSNLASSSSNLATLSSNLEDSDIKAMIEAAAAGDDAGEAAARRQSLSSTGVPRKVISEAA